jgi:hypothetical protein
MEEDVTKQIFGVDAPVGQRALSRYHDQHDGLTLLSGPLLHLRASVC